MPSNGTPSGAVESLQQVVLARFLFREGERALEGGNPMFAGLAVSLFQDSAELLIWTIAKSLDANIKDKAGFDAFWDAIKGAPGNDEHRELPSKAAMRELNKARVNFKHYGQIPLLSDAKRFRGATELFLRKAAEQFLSIDIEQVSLADLVRNDVARGKIKEAEKLLAEEKWQPCIEACSIAEKSIARDFESIIPGPDYRLARAADWARGREASGIKSTLHYLHSYLLQLRNVGIQALAGRNLRQYARFREIAPTVAFTLKGEPHFSHSKTRKVGKVEARFCVQYVIDFAIQAQERLGGTDTTLVEE